MYYIDVGLRVSELALKANDDGQASSLEIRSVQYPSTHIYVVYELLLTNYVRGDI